VNDSLTTPRVELSLPAPEKRRIVSVEPALLRSAVENLLSNALKYSAADEPVRLTLSHRIGATVISVQDHGLGVPAGEQDRLFQTFFRASNVGSVPGTGLGLRIVKNAMQLHGGEVRFQSELGRGSTFELILPNA
jgi:signal transduction histidine kinase